MSIGEGELDLPRPVGIGESKFAAMGACCMGALGGGGRMWAAGLEGEGVEIEG